MRVKYFKFIKNTKKGLEHFAIGYCKTIMQCIVFYNYLRQPYYDYTFPFLVLKLYKIL